MNKWTRIHVQPLKTSFPIFQIIIDIWYNHFTKKSKRVCPVKVAYMYVPGSSLKMTSKAPNNVEYSMQGCKTFEKSFSINPLSSSRIDVQSMSLRNLTKLVPNLPSKNSGLSFTKIDDIFPIIVFEPWNNRKYKDAFNETQKSFYYGNLKNTTLRTWCINFCFKFFKK